MTDPILLIIIVLVVAFSHIMAALPFFRKVSRQTLPRSIDYCCLAFLLYYDVGLLYELCGIQSSSPYFTLFSHAHLLTQCKAVGLLLVAPWILRFGASLVNPATQQVQVLRNSSLLPARKFEFYLICILIIIASVAFGGFFLLSKFPMWLVRTTVTERLGTALILLYIPLGILAFYLTQTNSHSKRGSVMLLCLLIAAMFAAYPIGERTNLLLPLVICLLFRRQLRLSHLFAMLVICFFAAAIILPIIKWQYAGRKVPVANLLSETIFIDLARAPVLTDVLEHSDSIGTKILPYTGAGYVYSLFFYIPRAWAPFKGYSSAVYYTSYSVHTAPEQTTWGFAIGCLEEIVLNFGFFSVFPILLFYGVFFGMCDRLAARSASFLAPASLGAVWVVGQHLPAVLLIFGTMTGVIWLCRRRYVDTSVPEVAVL